MDTLIRSWLPRRMVDEEIEAMNAELPFRSEPQHWGFETSICRVS